ncbi:DUF2924 domain-containing protein [Phyllobacterium phragmitis]|uniref:DUF2924 domain-containing protein n=1 Tax=Phyllobacterium phragmitis TaxID=2670329 RepID=A0ABQ0GWQ4_9HYPH
MSSPASIPQMEVSAFETLSRDECIACWTAEFGREPPKYTSVQFMRQALAYEAQVKAFGGHSTAVRRVLKSALKGKRKSSRKGGAIAAVPALSLRPGAHLVREWNGRTYQVEILEGGFRLDGKDYGSLSAIARKITGTYWSGPRFFGLVTR